MQNFLVEVDAYFYQKGDRVEIDSLDYELPENLPIEDVPEKEIIDSGEGKEFSYFRKEMAVFTEDVITYGFSLVNEGPLGYGFSAIESELDSVGWKSIMGGFDDFLHDAAVAARAEYPRMNGVEVPGVRFVVAMNIVYHNVGGYFGAEEYEPEYYFLGRIKLKDIWSKSLGENDGS